MYVDLLQYPHFVTCVAARPNAIPSLVVLDTTLQEVFLLIQDEHGDAMEDNE
jgi:hypothetical protein